MQIQGSGLGNFSSTAIVDTSCDAQHGRLWVNDADGLAIAKEEIANTSFIHKFGNAPNFDQADGIVSIWDGSDDDGIDEISYTYSTTNDIDSITSTSSTDTQVVEVQGLDEDFIPVTQEVTITGSGYTEIGTPLMRVFRIKNQGATDNTGNVCVYVSGPTTAGVPDTTTDIRACMGSGNNQTLMAIYTVPKGRTGYLDNWYASTAGATRTSSYVVDLRIRPSGGIFQLKHRSALEDAGTSHIQHDYNVPEVIQAMSDVEMRVRATTNNITDASVSAGFDITLVDQ